MEEHWAELVARSGVAEPALREAIAVLRSHVSEHSVEDYSAHLDRAMVLVEDSDPDDAPYVALALTLGADGLWSEDRRLSAVPGVRVFRTRDLISSAK